MTDAMAAFITKTFERRVNQKLLYYNLSIPYAELKDYAAGVCQLSIQNILDSLWAGASMWSPICAADVFQFSNFADATSNLCTILSKVGNPGVSFLSAGRLLLADGHERNDVAYRKYGENNLKAAELISLVFSIKNVYFLSGIGSIFNALDDYTRNALMIRLLVRNRLITQVLAKAHMGAMSLRGFLPMLSESTYQRRKSNLRHLFGLLLQSDEYNFKQLVDNIQFDGIRS